MTTLTLVYPYVTAQTCTACNGYGYTLDMGDPATPVFRVPCRRCAESGLVAA